MGIIDNIKEVVSLIQKTGNIDSVRQILDVQKEALDLLEQKGELQKRVSELEELIAIRSEVRFENGAYYRNREDGSREGPFCSRCLDVTDKLVMLHSFYNQNVGATISRCPECGTQATH